MKLTRKISLALIPIVILAVSSCATHSNAPDPTPDNVVQGTHTQVIQMPAGFRNVAFTCYNKNGIYVTSRGLSSDAVTSGIAVVVNDPLCS